MQKGTGEPATELDQFEKRGKRGRPRGKATETVYNALREEILTLQMRPGEYLDETQLERRFGVSRTPIREALIRLQADKLVHFSANRGHFVEVVNVDDIPAIFQAMDLYQAAVLRLAAGRPSAELLQDLGALNDRYLAAAKAADQKTMAEANHQFHISIGRACGNHFIAEAYESVMNHSLRLTYLMFDSAKRQPQEYHEYFERIYDEHGQMIALIADGRKDELEEISRTHIQQFCDRVAAFITSREKLRTEPRDFSAAAADS